MTNRDYAFQNYLVGNNNKAVVDVISSAMILPGRIHNPVFIYGTIGVGKTHLLQAIAKEYKSDYKICYVTAEQLVNDVIQSIQNYGYNNVTEQCLNLDVLLVDDIHLMKDKKFTIG